MASLVMKTFFELIAGICVLIGWYALVTQVVGNTDDGVGRLVLLFGLPAAAIIEKFLMGLGRDE
jgi:hypothetical protein